MLSSEHDFTSTSEQYQWFQQGLEKVNRSIFPWIIVTFHRPAYTAEDDKGEQSVATHLRLYLEPLWRKYEVNLILTGHIHRYERSCFVYQEICLGPESKAPVHMTVGTGGTDLSPDPVLHPSWKVRDFLTWGYLKVEANMTHLHTQFKSNENATVLDELWIFK